MPLYRGISVTRVGSGGSTSFWLDRWVGDAALCDVMPALFSHVTAPVASVCAVITAGVDAFLSTRLSTAAARERDSLLPLIVGAVLTPGTPDSREMTKCCGLKGAFSSSALYKLQMFGGVAAPVAAFVWGNHAPSRV
jgi:hypothetical protein